MKKINQVTISTVFILLVTVILNPAFAVQPPEADLTGDSVDKYSIPATPNNNEASTSQALFVVEESVFHRFIERGKANLSSIRQQLSFVFAKYSEVPGELAKSVYQLTEGRGAGYLAKMILLFLLLIAIGVGAEKFSI